VVYGHRGTNQESGWAESCAASELVHGFDTSRSTLSATINSLTPTGWTPLGGVLDYTSTIIADLPPSTDDDPIAPVIYLLSDGEETCDGNPVQAAQTLYEAGVQTIVNTLGFAVDAETAAQLEQIATAGGGAFYAADSASALRDRLNAIKEAEASAIWYQYCVNQNVGRIQVVYHNAGIELAGCYQRNNPARQRSALFNAITRLRSAEGPEASCVDELNEHALYGYDAFNMWLPDRATALNDASARLAAEYREGASLAALGAAE
jgi:Ca-activated chloride channel family protein